MYNEMIILDMRDKIRLRISEMQETIFAFEWMAKCPRFKWKFAYYV